MTSGFRGMRWSLDIFGKLNLGLFLMRVDSLYLWKINSLNLWDSQETTKPLKIPIPTQGPPEPHAFSPTPPNLHVVDGTV